MSIYLELFSGVIHQYLTLITCYYFLFGRSINEATQMTLIRGPGDKLKIIAKAKPRPDIASPNIEDLAMAIHKDGAFFNPNKVGLESNAMTSITPTADIELTMTSAVVKLRAKFK